LHAPRKQTPPPRSGAPTWLLAAAVLALMLLVGSWALLGTKPPPPEDAGGTTIAAGDWLVAMDYGLSGDNVTWVVLRAWPEGTDPAARAADDRFDAGSARIRRPDGRLVNVAGTRTLYFFSTDGVFVAPIVMHEHDLRPVLEGTFDSPTALEEYFTRFGRSGS